MPWRRHDPQTEPRPARGRRMTRESHGGHLPRPELLVQPAVETLNDQREANCSVEAPHGVSCTVTNSSCHLRCKRVTPARFKWLFSAGIALLLALRSARGRNPRKARFGGLTRFPGSGKFGVEDRAMTLTGNLLGKRDSSNQSNLNDELVDSNNESGRCR